MESFKTLLKTDKTGLIDGYCKIPWENFLINQTGNIFACNCEGKVRKSLGNILEINSIDDFFNILNKNDFKDSILDGSYKFCYGNSCELIQKNIYYKETTPFFLKNKLELTKLQYQTIYLQIDESCNLQCPSCRDKIIIHKNNKVSRKIEKILYNLENYFLQSYDKEICLRLCGNGELFASPSINKWFLNFNFSQYNNVNFFLHSNGTLWEKNKDFIINNGKRFDGAEISIDAANEEVYKKVRKKGHWQDVLNGLSIAKLLKTINPNFHLSISFVLSSQNYFQIQDFINLGNQFEVDFIKFYRVQRLDMNEEKFKKLNIFNPKHSEHDKFIEIFKTCKFQKNTNLSQIIPWL